MSEVTLAEIRLLLPDASIEEVGDRRELVIYTGLAAGTYDADEDEWRDLADDEPLVPFPEELDR